MEQPEREDNPLQRLTIFAVASISAVILAIITAIMIEGRRAPPIVIADPRPDVSIVISIEGAVATPGVYALPGDARVYQALEAAGGARDDADLTEVSLARRLDDEERILVPSVGVASLPMDDPPAAVSEPVISLININTASAAELNALPSIGDALASRIVDYRSKHGPFQSVEVLAEIQGISPRMVEELRPLVTIGP